MIGIKLHPNDPYIIYTADQSAINLNMDLYSSHPVYMDLRNVGCQVTSHGVLLLNSNGMDVIHRGNSLTYKLLLGFWIFTSLLVELHRFLLWISILSWSVDLHLCPTGLLYNVDPKYAA